MLEEKDKKIFNLDGHEICCILSRKLHIWFAKNLWSSNIDCLNFDILDLFCKLISEDELFSFVVVILVCVSELFLRINFSWARVQDQACRVWKKIFEIHLRRFQRRGAFILPACTKTHKSLNSLDTILIGSFAYVIYVTTLRVHSALAFINETVGDKISMSSSSIARTRKNRSRKDRIKWLRA